MFFIPFVSPHSPENMHVRFQSSLCFFSFLAAAALLSLTGTALAQQRPNIILIFVDDMGINDIGAYAYPNGNPYPGSGPTPISYSSSYNPLPAPNEAAALTPNIDSLGTQGIRMTSFYAAAPVCTPSRSGLLTGSYATRVDMEGVIWNSSHTWGLNPSEVTIAERLRQAGYTTGLVGKWHVGTFGGSFGMDFHPTHHGFDTFFGLPASNDAFLTTLWDGKAEVSSYVTGTGGTLTSPVDTVAEQRHLLEALTEKAIDFIQAADTAQKPFFLYFASHAPHTPCWPHPAFINASSGAGQYYDVVAELDARVGQILSELDTLGIANDTLVLFTSDNGPWVDRPDRSRAEQRSGSAYPYRGYKRGANEGGPRVPFLARYPGQIPAGTVTDELGSAIDFLPTFLSLADEALPAATIDGVNLWPLLSGQTSTSPRSEFFYYEENDTSAVGVRQGDDKLLNRSDYSATTGWFDLSSDVQESSNLGANSTLSALISSHNSAMVRRTRATSRSNWIEIDNDSVTVTEGGTATFNVRLHAAANTTVSISHFSGDSDLSVQSGGSLTFTTGNYDQWQTVTLAAAADADTTSDGATFRATASGLHLREIFALERDVPPNPQGALFLSASSYHAGEGDGTVTLTVSRLGGSSGAVSVDYATADGTAVAGSDYTSASGTLNWGDGDSTDKTFDVTLTDDSEVEPDETFTATISNPGGGAGLGAPVSATVTLTDNDVPPPPTAVYTIVIDFGKSGQETGGNWNNLSHSTVSSGSTTTIASDLRRFSDNALTGVGLDLQVLGSGGNSGIAGLDVTTNDGSASFAVSGAIPTTAQQDLTFHVNAQSQFIFTGLNDALTYNIAFQSWTHTTGRDAGDWTIQPGLAGEATLTIDPNDSPSVYTFSDIATDGSGNITLLRVGTGGGAFNQHINALELTALSPLPSAPSGLGATTVSSSQIDLSWTDNSDNETGFKVQRASSSGGPWSDVRTTAAEATSYSDTGLSEGTEYFYQVLATNGASDSAASNEASATTWTAAENWREQYFGQTANTGDAADGFDYDRGGSVNLLERAFGTDPTDSSDDYTPFSSMVDVSGSDYLGMTYRRLAGGSGTTGVDYTVDGLTYTVEHDDNLSPPWSSGNITVVSIQEDTPVAGVQTVTVRLNTATGSVTRQFIRLKLEATD